MRHISHNYNTAASRSVSASHALHFPHANAKTCTSESWQETYMTPLPSAANNDHAAHDSYVYINAPQPMLLTTFFPSSLHYAPPRGLLTRIDNRAHISQMYFD